MNIYLYYSKICVWHKAIEIVFYTNGDANDKIDFKTSNKLWNLTRDIYISLLGKSLPNNIKIFHLLVSFIMPLE